MSRKQKTLRERLRRAAENLKGRSKDMTEEEKTEQQETETPVNETAEQAQEPGKEEPKKQELPDAETLAAALKEAEAKRDEYLDMAQRGKAEFVNYKRRTESARAEAYDDGRRDAVEKLLPVVDNLERALAAAGEEESSLRSGVEMTLRQTLDIFTKMGVIAIDPAGELFDANEMNAVMQGTAEEGEPGTVCQVLQKGYKLGNRVIRHAMVKVVAG